MRNALFDRFNRNRFHSRNTLFLRRPGEACHEKQIGWSYICGLNGPYIDRPSQVVQQGKYPGVQRSDRFLMAEDHSDGTFSTLLRRECERKSPVPGVRSTPGRERRIICSRRGARVRGFPFPFIARNRSPAPVQSVGRETTLSEPSHTIHDQSRHMEWYISPATGHPTGMKRRHR